MLHVNMKKAAALILAVAALGLSYIFAQTSDPARAGGAATQVKSRVETPDLEAKLSQKASFMPQQKSPLSQLIEVAKHFQIPMGIEWVEQTGAAETSLNVAADSSVQELLAEILKRSPTHTMEIKNGVVHISSPAFATAPRNLLNLRIQSFQVRNESLLDAEEQLQLAIDMELHPEEYAEGYNGGYGYDPGSVFAVRNVSFSGKNLAVREILDGIAKANGNALWVSRLDPVKLSAEETASPNAKQERQPRKVVDLWEFIPFRNVVAGK